MIETIKIELEAGPGGPVIHTHDFDIPDGFDAANIARMIVALTLLCADKLNPEVNDSPEKRNVGRHALFDLVSEQRSDCTRPRDGERQPESR